MTRKVSRRELIRVGALGMVGLTLPKLMSVEQASAGESRLAEMSCIFVVQYGGASHLDTLDPKPQAPTEIRGPYRPTATSAAGVQISEMLPELAKQAHHFALVRSMTHGKSDHNGGMHVCLTGASRPTETTPPIGSIVARLRQSRGGLPPYLWIQDLDRDIQSWYLKGGSLGQVYGPMLIAERENHFAKPGYRVSAFDPPKALSADRVRQRVELLDTLEGISPASLNHGSASDWGVFQERAIEISSGAGAAAAFDISRETPRIRDRYGRGPFGQNLLAARRLVEAGVRLVTVNAWCGYPPTEKFIFTQGWDHHGAKSQQGGIFSDTQHGLGFVLPRFDQALSALIEDLHQRGLLDRTLVVVVGEFGRTPKISQNPYVGRDHWPGCYTALFAGGGVRGGQVWGESDKHGASPARDPVKPEDFAATIFHALSISTVERLAIGLPAVSGKAVTGIFA